MKGGAITKYILDGDIRETEIRELERALSGPEWTVDRSGDELEIEADGVVIDIYDHAPDRQGRQYLISGRFTRDLVPVKALLEVLSQRLRSLGVAHRLELSDGQGNEVHTMEDFGPDRT